MPAPTVAVVGAGLSGAACARVLEQAGVRVEVHDRAHAPGGRMASPRLPDARSVLPVERAPRRPRRELLHRARRGASTRWSTAGPSAGLPARGPRPSTSRRPSGGLGERKSGPLRWGSPVGLRALVEDLLLGVDVHLASPVRHVGPGPVLDGRPYDAVVLALPDPQAEPLLDASLEAERAAVADRGWTPVLALAAGFAERTWPSTFDGCFVNGSDVLEWVADDGRRRGDRAPVLVAHSGADLAGQHLADPDAARPAMVAALRELLDLPEPAWTRVQRWSLARPAEPREQDFHLGPARVGLCGDGWGSPRVETAWRSGTLLGRALVDELL